MQAGCGRVWMDGPAKNEYVGGINQGPFLEVCTEGRLNCLSFISSHPTNKIKSSRDSVNEKCSENI